MAKPSAKSSAARKIINPIPKSFQARLERMPSRLNWIIIYVPFNVAKTWGTRAQLRVKGEINGFPFRTAIFPTGRGEHFFMVNKQMQAGGRTGPGAMVKVRLEPDTARRAVTVPQELERILAQNRSLGRWFAQLSHSMRREISTWIAQAKSAEVRLRRSEQLAERLLATMEGERHLPPILQIAFAQEPRARQGWQLMSPLQRRMHLLSVFYYRSPEARSRRVEKVVAEALRIAGRKTKGRVEDERGE